MITLEARRGPKVVISAVMNIECSENSCKSAEKKIVNIRAVGFISSHGSNRIKLFSCEKVPFPSANRKDYIQPAHAHRLIKVLCSKLLLCQIPQIPKQEILRTVQGLHWILWYE